MTGTKFPSGVEVRRATGDDAGVILMLVDALANYEKLAPPDEAARARLVRDMSGEQPPFEVYLAEYEGRPAGYAIALES